MAVEVRTAGRLHFGFQNLSLAHERLYGSVGLALDAPPLRLEVEPAGDIDVSHPAAERYARRVVDLLGVSGARIEIRESLPRHVGLGSGTQFALATLAGVARAYDRDPAVRERAPDLGRGGRSGVGVAAFECGGFVIDAGHSTTRFTSDRPREGEWSVPPVTVRHDVPDDWRFVLALPDVPPGTHGEEEDADMRTVVEHASPGIADEITAITHRRLLPAVVEGRVGAFGAAVEEIGRLNGAWYADAQGGVYRPPVGRIVRELAASSAIDGAGQSSWGPLVYGVTDRRRADAAERAARGALEAAGVDGETWLVAARNAGATVERRSRHKG